ncbi:MAG TPA: sensor domain-containing diguanylate cyclase [Pyrinomonadaceae bacterium]|jgi:diguanylate cyclase (GGDEF)-like protein
MKTSKKPKISDNPSNFFAPANLILPAFSLAALAVTFFVSISALAFEIKVKGFLTVIVFYLLFCAAFYFFQKRKIDFDFAESEAEDSIFNEDVERQLLALEEASQFFGASLKPADMFRLVASRVNEMIPFASAALFRAQDDGRGLKAIGACGENARALINLEIKSLKGLSGKTFLSRQIQRDENLELEKNVIPPETLKNLESAMAAPLFRNGNAAFAVLVLYGDAERRFDAAADVLLEAIAERIAPLFLSSIAFEQSLSSALTDALTNLPNERAFYLILENQMAESQRQRDQRPLTILTVDAKKFAELNQRFGHATGDRILAFAAENIKAQLRKMDFLSRSSSDEFLIVLPTASESIAAEIVERIEKAFRENPFEIEGGETIYLEFNFGAATYLRDGETAQQLLQNARLRKQEAKPGAGRKILRFPQELVQ